VASRVGDRRRDIIVDVPTQKKMLFRSATLPLAALVTGEIAMLWFSKRGFEQAREVGEVAPSFGVPVAPTVVFIVGARDAAIWLAKRQSHRIVGPAYRLQKSLHRIRHGELDFKITLRASDELPRLVDESNPLLVFLRKRESRGEADPTSVTGSPEAGPAAAEACHVETAARPEPITEPRVCGSR